jgi:hypothetical protein
MQVIVSARVSTKEGDKYPFYGGMAPGIKSILYRLDTLEE